mmetsp:Transcript_49089/g.36152  ORF Transcript_49089/g.36152 Transcript_49089/m.36152 type:complete len:86 (+) Transcript_49089:1094-1351(+)
MAISAHYHSIIIRGVPRLSLERRDLLRRFILLIDELYFHHRQVIIEAERPIDELFEEPETDSQFDEQFAFDRCASRLKEMQTKEY